MRTGRTELYLIKTVILCRLLGAREIDFPSENRFQLNYLIIIGPYIFTVFISDNILSQRFLFATLGLV
jgi:hypothetical protein